ncbi:MULTISPECIES: hypothetical protein [unclassified Rhizobium]|uniref:hypothetical protein n=1 Tax=unclassified Rhizobium TaxID=2613769 RepID=UPI002889A7C0|nr:MULTISPECIES: hypothetical protein [unclassified Rhizobium]
MADRPILFSAPMIRALLAGTKTQTRRILNPQPHLIGTTGSYIGKDGKCHKLRIDVGDRLYVREHWRVSNKYDDHSPAKSHKGKPVLRPRAMTVFFDAGGSIANQASGKWEPGDWNAGPQGEPPKWVGKNRQAMHMPRWASRLTLTVTDVRVERLQDISGSDAIAEGADITGEQTMTGPMVKVAPGTYLSPVAWYHRLWDSINGAGAWEANPWVVAYSFTVHHGNIDQIAQVAA